MQQRRRAAGEHRHVDDRRPRTASARCATVCSRPTLPAAIVRPTTSWRGSSNAISRASASSTPGSVSISRGMRRSWRHYAVRDRGDEARLCGSVARRAADPAARRAVGERGVVGEQAVGEARAPAAAASASRARSATRNAGQAGLARAEQFARAAQLAGPSPRSRSRRWSRASSPGAAAPAPTAATGTAARSSTPRCRARPGRAAGAAATRPRRSAFSMIISEAFGTSTPTSITVVATSRSSVALA